MGNLKDLVRPLYTDGFTVKPRTDPAVVMAELLADDFRSVDSTATKTKPQLIGQIQFFHKVVPDLRWEIQDMLQDGDRVVVRSIASGTPKGDFMGMPTDGTKSFKIMTIDIHVVERGQIHSVHHLEDWATAMRQLKG